MVASYGSLCGFFLRFLYPFKPIKKGWIYAAQVRKIAKGSSIPFKAPDGTKIEIARRGDTGKASDFIALSSVCPHLGCMVRWEPHNNRFFCPCHNGVFDLKGIAISGPPAKAGQKLKQFPLKVQRRLLFIHVDLERMG